MRRELEEIEQQKINNSRDLIALKVKLENIA